MTLASLVANPSAATLVPWDSSSSSSGSRAFGSVVCRLGVHCRRSRIVARDYVGGKSLGAGCEFSRGRNAVGSSIPGVGVSRIDECRVWRRERSSRDAGLGLRKQTRGGRRGNAGLEARASALQDAVVGVMEAVKAGWMANPPTWEAAFVATGSVFAVGAPVLLIGLTKSGIACAYLLGSVIWRAYGGQGAATIMLFYLFGTGATKLKMKEKQKEGIAEKRSGKRGYSSVVGSGTAAAICALCSIYGIGGPDIAPLWQLGYLASLCTKLSDTISSEIGKAYGKTTYLVTTLSVVPRGTEGAVSVEGTVAGVVAAIFLAAAALALGQVDQCGAIIAVIASQVANLFESFLGATLQGQPGYEWLSNDVVNIANITVGAGLAILAGKYVGSGL